MLSCWLRLSDGSHGDLSLVCSVYEDQRVWLEVGQCDAAVAEKGGSVWIRARLSTVRAKGKTAFVVLRKGLSSVQAVVADGTYGWDKDGIKCHQQRTDQHTAAATLTAPGTHSPDATLLLVCQGPIITHTDTPRSQRSHVHTATVTARLRRAQPLTVSERRPASYSVMAAAYDVHHTLCLAPPYILLLSAPPSHLPLLPVAECRLGKVTVESIVDVYGDVVRIEQPTHTSQSEVEVKIRKLFVVSLASPHLPFQLIDASRPVAAEHSSSQTAAVRTAEATADGAAEQAGGDGENKADSSAPASNEAGGGGLSVDNEGVITVGQDLRLDNRWIDLRTPANHAIFRLQSRVCQYYRQFFLDRDFIEIHTPKLTPGVSEGGAAVFRLKYFEQDACLAQSPQLYKQMAVASDLRRVFEIGPVFRAEYSNSQLHTHIAHSASTQRYCHTSIPHRMLHSSIHPLIHCPAWCGLLSPPPHV